MVDYRDDKMYQTTLGCIAGFCGTVYIKKLLSITEREFIIVLLALLCGVGIWSVKKKATRRVSKEIIYFLFALYISASFYLGRLSWKMNVNYYVNLDSILIILLGAVFFFTVISSILYSYNDYYNFSINTEVEYQLNKLPHMGAIYSMLLFIAWIPSLIINYPGILISDYTWQYNQAIGRSGLSNHHPIIHTMLIRLSNWISLMVFRDGKSENTIFINSIIQMLICALVLGYICSKLTRRSTSKRQVLISFCVVGAFAFFPLYSIFSVYMTKDIIFSVLVALWSVQLFELTIKLENTRGQLIADVIECSVVGILCIWFRSNGFLIVLGTMFFLLIFFYKNISIRIIFLLCFIGFIVETPLLSVMGIPSTELVESIGLPINQIANVVNCEEDISQEEQELIERVMDMESIKSTYNIRYSDHLKFSQEFNADVIDANKGEYFKLWVKLFVKYPKDYIEAWLNLTIGYWYPGVEKSCISYDYDSRFSLYDQLEVESYSTSDLERHFLTTDVRNNVWEAWMWSPGGVVMILFSMVVLCIGLDLYKLLIIYIPSLFGWFSLMIATPSYCETRYVYFVFLIIPIALFYVVKAGECGIDEKK